MDSFYKERFDSVQALRGIAALSVVFSHISFLEFGAFGPEIFFCISGFVMMLSTEKSTEKYWRKRLVRVIPLYYLMTFGTFFLLLLFPNMFMMTRADGGELVKSLLFIPFDIGGGILAPILKVGWTVYYEIFFYLVLYIALKISFRYRGLICAGIVIILVAITALTGTKNPFLLFYGSPIALEFLLGILIYYVFRRIYHLREENRLPAYLGGLCLALAVVVYAYLCITGQGIFEDDFWRFITWGIPSMLLVALFITAGLWIKMPKFIVKIGDMSYSLYFIHYYPIMLLNRRFFGESGITPMTVSVALVGIIVCIGISYVSYLLIEKKLPKLVLK